MPTPANRAGARALVVVTAIVVGALVAADLLRTDSLLRDAWDRLFGSRSQVRRFLEGLRVRGPRWGL